MRIGLEWAYYYLQIETVNKIKYFVKIMLEAFLEEVMVFHFILIVTICEKKIIS